MSPEVTAALRRGRAVILHGDHGELAGDHHLLLSAEKASPHGVAFMVRHTSGFVRAVLTQTDADRLDLPPMYTSELGAHGTRYAVTVDASDNVTTGISATDRCTTLQTLADPDTVPTQLRRPGHVVPVRADDLGLLGRPGYAEAVIDLMRLAGLRPVGALSELVSEQGTPLSPDQVAEFCRIHRTPVVSVADVLEHRLTTEPLVERVTESHLTIAGQSLRLLGFRGRLGGGTHLALCFGDVDRDPPPTLHVVQPTPDGRPTAPELPVGVAAEGPTVVLYLGPTTNDCADALGPGTFRSALVHQILAELGVRGASSLAEQGSLVST